MIEMEERMKEILNVDEDMEQILRKMEEETGLLCVRERNENLEIQTLGEYCYFSLGKTSRELREQGFHFYKSKDVANDYNGPKPSYSMTHIKLLYSPDYKILGVQMIGKGNLERRYEILQTFLSEGKGLKELSEYSIYGKSLEEEMDILNLSAFYAMEVDRPLISVEEVRDLQQAGAFFLDVREEEEHEYARILGSKNIPLHSLVRRMSEIPKEEKVYVYCRSAHRSLDAVNFLRGAGYDNVYNVEGGFIGISYEEYTKDKERKRKKIVNRYHFE